MDDISTLKALRAQYEVRLAENSDFQAWRALDRAVSALSGNTRISDAKPTKNIEKMSHTDAAVAVLRKRGFPMKTQEILDAVRELGVAVNGAKPSINLSSSMSRDERLKSISWNGERAWWIEGEKITPPGLVPNNGLFEAEGNE